MVRNTCREILCSRMTTPVCHAQGPNIHADMAQRHLLKMRPGAGVLLDIGANIGWWSSIFALFNFSVIAIEPMATNRRVLEATLCLNPAIASRVTILERMALGARGTCALTPREVGNQGNGHLNCTPLAVAECAASTRATTSTRRGRQQCQLVPVRPLDDVLRTTPVLSRLWHHRHADETIVVKMDVEGAECDILSTGQALFTRVRPDLLIAEARLPHVKVCLERHARAHGYLVSKPFGRDSNVLLYRPALPLS